MRNTKRWSVLHIKDFGSRTMFTNNCPIVIRHVMHIEIQNCRVGILLQKFIVFLSIFYCSFWTLCPEIIQKINGAPIHTIDRVDRIAILIL